MSEIFLMAIQASGLVDGVRGMRHWRLILQLTFGAPAAEVEFCQLVFAVSSVRNVCQHGETRREGREATCITIWGVLSLEPHAQGMLRGMVLKACAWEGDNV